MSARLVLLGALVIIGAAWGVTQPWSKMAVTAGHAPLGLIFWQLFIAAILLGGITLARGKRLSTAPRHLFLYVVILMTGTLLPNFAGYTAALHLPAGVMSIVISIVPMVSFPIAIAMGTDRFSVRRLMGLVLGFTAILFIALPEASLPDPAMAAWLPLAVIAPIFYAFEGNYVARYGTEGLDPVQALAGAAVLGVIIVLPLALVTGGFSDPRLPWDRAEAAIVGVGLAHALAYTGYVWLVGRAGAVFAAQVSYLVTGFGVFWAWLILSESYSGWIWAALAFMFAGLFLVQPRQQGPLPPQGGAATLDATDSR